MRVLEPYLTSRETLQEIEAMRAYVVTNYRDPSMSTISGFATRLSTFLVAEGFPNHHEPCGYVQRIKVVVATSTDGITFSTNVEVGSRQMYCNGVPTYTVGEVLRYLHSSRARYLKYLIERDESRSVTRYCEMCHYADDDAQYCGLGMQMSIDCNHRVINEG